MMLGTSAHETERPEHFSGKDKPYDQLPWRAISLETSQAGTKVVQAGALGKKAPGHYEFPPDHLVISLVDSTKGKPDTPLVI